MSEQRPRRDANNCFVCGPVNPVGLRIRFHVDEAQVCRAAFVPADHHAGYDRMTHGGIIYSALDDVMANWLFLGGMRAHTARCAVRYRQPHPTGIGLRLEGRRVRQRGKVAFMTGLAFRADDGSLVAEAEASFMIVGATAGDLYPGGESNSPMS